MQTQNKTVADVIVIGGGIAGCAAAHSLQKRGYSVTIIEQNDRLGGRIRSETIEGTAIEMGAGFFTNAYTNVRAFLGSEGLDTDIYKQHGNASMVRDGKLYTIHNALTALTTPAISWGAKLQAVKLLMEAFAAWPSLDVHRPWLLSKYDDISAAGAYTGTKASQEFLEYILQPVLNGYLYWTPEQTSKAILLLMAKARTKGGSYKLNGGLQQIPEHLAAGSQVLLEHTVKQIERTQDGAYIVTVEHNAQQHILQARSIVCATTASVVPRIIPNLTPAQRDFFTAIAYSSTAVLAQSYLTEQTKGDKGIAFPRSEGSKLASVTVAPEPKQTGRQLSSLKMYTSGAVGKQLCAQTDQEIVATLQAAMEPVASSCLHDGAQPIATHVQRWPEALPHFDVGHFRRLQDFADGKIEDPTGKLVFAGDYLGGPLMEGAFTSGVNATERLTNQMQCD